MYRIVIVKTQTIGISEPISKHSDAKIENIYKPKCYKHCPKLHMRVLSLRRNLSRFASGQVVDAADVFLIIPDLPTPD